MPKIHGAALFLEEYADTRLMEDVGAVFFERIVKSLMKQTPDEAPVKKGIEELMPAAMAYLESLAPEGDGIVGGRFSVAGVAIGSQFVNWGHAGQSIDAKNLRRGASGPSRRHSAPTRAHEASRPRDYRAASWVRWPLPRR
jgi:glutathione S-transferase